MLALAAFLAALSIVPIASSQAPPTPGATAICLEASTNEYWMRVRNPRDAELPFTWRDQNSSQTGSGTAPPLSDTFIKLDNGAARHTWIVSWAGGQAVKASNTNPCQGKVTVSKVVAGDGTPPAEAAWPFEITGTSGTDRRFTLGAAASRTEDKLPGGIEPGSVPIGTTPPGGYAYTIRETDALGANVSSTVDSFLVSASGDVKSTFTNGYARSPVPTASPVVPPPGTTPPPAPTPPPSPPATPPASPPTAPTAARPQADLGITVAVSPARGRVDDPFTFRVRIENRGPSTAVNTVGTDIPTLAQPNRTARVEFVRTSQGACTSFRPVRCDLGDIPSGGVVDILARARVEIDTLLSATVRVTSDVFDPNLTNNQDVAGLAVDPGPAGMTLRKQADRSTAAAGGPVGFSLRLASRGPTDAVNLRVCDALPRPLALVSASAGSFMRRGQVCWTVNRLAPDAVRRFSLRVGTDPGSAGRLTNVAAATGANVARREAAASIRLRPRQDPGRPGGVTG